MYDPTTRYNWWFRLAQLASTHLTSCAFGFAVFLSTIDTLAKIEDPSVQAPKVDTIISEPIGRWMMKDVHTMNRHDRLHTFRCLIGNHFDITSYCKASYSSTREW